LYGIPDDVSQAGNIRSVMSLAFSRNILSADKSYALRRPPTTLNNKSPSLDNLLTQHSYPKVKGKKATMIQRQSILDNNIIQQVKYYNRPYCCFKHACFVILVKV
jgi:hypothetical protein